MLNRSGAQEQATAHPMTIRHFLADSRSWLTAIVSLVAAALFLASPAQAQAPRDGATHITPSLIAEQPAQPGETLMLAIRMEPASGWHGYWLNPGDAGLGMQLDWSLPAGWKAGEPQYPVPTTLLVSGLMNHVYKGEYAVLVPVDIPQDARAGTRATLTLDAQWLACTDELCVPEQGRLETQITLGATGAEAANFDGWRARLPAPLNADARFEQTGTAIRLAIPLPASAQLAAPHVFIAQDRVISYAAPQNFSRNGNVIVVELQRPAMAKAEPETISGIIRLDSQGLGLSFSAAPGQVPAAGTPISDIAGAAAISSLPLLLLGALAGGFLLNIMPCVFPILSLKALSLARSGESDSKARIEGLAYTAGVILACLALGALLLILRAGGEQIGWAFQLQEPGVIVLLLLLAVAITANFAGLFEFSLPGFPSEGAPQGAFATGLLAAFVATPCTGPFMAAAMGAALLLPVGPAMLLFAALGLGLALPFVLIAFIPALRRRLPRPGPWMNRFRLWMAVPMGLTALALLWLAYRIAGPGFAWAAGVGSALLIALLYLAGLRQRRGTSALAITAAGLGGLALAAIVILPRLESRPVSDAPGKTGAIAFSQTALSEARQSGKPVFVWMTADWCITCKVNEQVAITREDTLAAFRKAGVVMLRGDWTRRDPAITRYLTAQGAAGVPLYVWYPGNGKAPQTLPQVLTPSTLIDLTKP